MEKANSQLLLLLLKKMHSVMKYSNLKLLLLLLFYGGCYKDTFIDINDIEIFMQYIFKLNSENTIQNKLYKKILI